MRIAAAILILIAVSSIGFVVYINTATPVAGGSSAGGTVDSLAAPVTPVPELRDPSVKATPALGDVPTLAKAPADVYDPNALLAATLDSVRADFARHLVDREIAFRKIPRLGSKDKRALKRSRNAKHVEFAKRHGVNGDISVHELTTGGLLVRMPDTTDLYVLQNNAGLLTPNAVEVVEYISERFREATAEAGLPPYRLTVSSTFRSPADQKALRRRNTNATSGQSSHEFGTTFDLAYQRYASAPEGVLDSLAFVVPDSIPAPARAELARELQVAERSWSVEAAARYPSRMQALLGRVMIDLEDEGVLLVVREWRQPCFHATVAQSAPAFASGRPGRKHS